MIFIFKSEHLHEGMRNTTRLYLVTSITANYQLIKACLLIVQIHVYWHQMQEVCIQFGKSTSGYFRISNGVRQGGIFSPKMFSLVMNPLTDTLLVSLVAILMINVLIMLCMLTTIVLWLCSHSGSYATFTYVMNMAKRTISYLIY